MDTCCSCDMNVNMEESLLVLEKSKHFVYELFSQPEFACELGDPKEWVGWEINFCLSNL